MKLFIKLFLMMIVVSVAHANNETSEYLDYKDLITLIEKGEVQTLILKNYPNNATAKISNAKSNRLVSVSIPWCAEGIPDPLLQRLLDKQNVTLKKEKNAETQWQGLFSMISLWAFPLLNFILIVVLHFRFSRLRKTRNG